MRSRITMSAHPGHFVFWVVLVIFVLSAAGCESMQKNPITVSDKNLAIQNIPLVDSTQWYVSTSGNDANQCHTTADTCRNIQTAIDRASDGDTIHIADGSYYEQLSLTKPLKIDGASTANTIIDAQLNNRPVTLDGTGSPNGFNLDLSDVTLTGGAAGKGGGISIDRGAYIVLTNVEIRNNTGHSAGGGIYSVNTAWLILNNVSIHDNQTGTGEGRGGGIFFSTGEDKQGYFPAFFKMDMHGSQIFHNNAATGAGIFNGATMSVINTIIESNTAVSVGGGIYNEYDISIGRCKILNNTAKSGGGVFNGSDYLPGIIPGAVIFETEISGNSAITGGGILNEQGLNLTSSTIYNNAATGKGGGVYNATFFDSYPGGTDWAGKFYSINSTISGNSAASGGGIWNGDQSGGGFIPGLFEGAHLTIADNTGGGIYYHYGSLKIAQRSVLQ